MTFNDWLTGDREPTADRTPHIDWHLPLHGMVRAPLPDPRDPSALYLVTYREKFREYCVYRVDRESGEVRWSTQIRNGGYGSPLVHRDLVCALSRFTAVTGLDKTTGEILWEYDPVKRVRSSVSNGLQDDEIVITAGNEIHWIGTDGKRRTVVSLEETVFFGLTRSVQLDGSEVVLTLGTKQRFRTSHVYLFAVGRDSNVRWEHDLGPGFVVSSDTSGFALQDGVAIVTTADRRMVAVDVSTGERRWATDIGVLGVRHTPVVARGRAYASTLEGALVSVDAETGSDLQVLPLTERGMWMPPTVVGEDVFVVADNELLQISADDLAVLSRTPIGEAPYSAVTYDGRRLYIGGGDPPYDGYLFCLSLDGGAPPFAVASVRETIDAARSEDISISIRIMGPLERIESVEIDLCCLGGEVQRMLALDPTVYTGQCRLSRGRRFGTYALPVLIRLTDGTTVVRTVRARIADSSPIPVRHELDIVVPKQETRNTSGGAVLQAIFAQYGRRIEQREVRRIADYALDVSDDYSAFQLWRLITRRVAATSAENLSAFKQAESSRTVAATTE